MKKRTKEEVAAEIAALEKLKPVGPFARKTAETISIQIDALKCGVDDTAEEWDELTDEQQMAARDAENWANGDEIPAPSKDWGALCE